MLITTGVNSLNFAIGVILNLFQDHNAWYIRP